MNITIDSTGLDVSDAIRGFVNNKLELAFGLVDKSLRGDISAVVTIEPSGNDAASGANGSANGGPAEPGYFVSCATHVYGTDLHAEATATGLHSAIRQMKQRLSWKIIEIDRARPT